MTRNTSHSRTAAVSGSVYRPTLLRKAFLLGASLILSAIAAFALAPVHGTIQKINAAAKTMVVKTADGTEHTFRFLGSTVVHGTEKAVSGTVAGFKGLAEGSEVLVRYSAKGTEKTAVEIDHLGKGGLKIAEGTITRVDHAGKTIAIRTASGAEEVFSVSANAVEDVGEGAAKGGEKSAKVVVHYSEKGGRKVARFCRKVI